jgi:hypothetical protein
MVAAEKSTPIPAIPAPSMAMHPRASAVASTLFAALELWDGDRDAVAPVRAAHGRTGSH